MSGGSFYSGHKHELSILASDWFIDNGMECCLGVSIYKRNNLMRNVASIAVSTQLTAKLSRKTFPA